jgi:hypothetical protein
MNSEMLLNSVRYSVKETTPTGILYRQACARDFDNRNVTMATAGEGRVREFIFIVFFCM